MEELVTRLVLMGINLVDGIEKGLLMRHNEVLLRTILTEFHVQFSVRIVAHSHRVNIGGNG
jgi:hypothetical protein